MQVPDQDALTSLAKQLDMMEPRLPYHLWIEQPLG